MGSINSTQGALQNHLGSSRPTLNHDEDSVNGNIRAINEHIHTEQRTYPTLADGVGVDSGATNWAEGTITQVIPADTITSDFDIHFLNIEAVGDDGVYQVNVYYGDSNTFAGSIRFNVDGTGAIKPTVGLKHQTPIIPANSKVSLGLAYSKATLNGAQTIMVSLVYHKYD